MKVLITGANGQLGSALRGCVPQGIECLAVSREALDITDAIGIERTLTQANITSVINAAAYTDVASAEKDSNGAFRINSEGTAALAKACAERNIPMIHVSTDFVFDGTKRTPYSVDDEPHPQNVYGASKLEGELRAMAILKSELCVVRTSWLHGAPGSNFVTKVLSRMATTEPVKVVTDEIGSPTSAISLAEALWRCAEHRVGGLHHWSDEGSVTRFEFAVAIGDRAHALGLLKTKPIVVPALSKEFPSTVRRPAYSVLDTRRTQDVIGMKTRDWKSGLDLTLRGLLQAQVGAK